MKLPEGLYEQPITLELEAALAELTTLIARSDVTIESAPQVFARLIHDATVLALRNVAGEERLEAQVALTNRLLTILSEAAPRSGITTEDAVRVPPELLMSVRAGDDVRLGTAEIARPTLPLRHSDLLVNGPRDLRIGHEVPLELASADRVDLLVAFVKWSGYRLLRSDLEHFLARRPGALRVLTTTYLGASERGLGRVIDAFFARSFLPRYETQPTTVSRPSLTFRR